MTLLRPHKTRRRKGISPGQRLFIWVYYAGPFRLISDWLWKVGESGIHANMTDAEIDALPVLVKDGSLRDRAACLFDRLDHWWISHYTKQGRLPPARWKKS